MYKQLFVILFLVTVNLISSSQSLPSFRWRKNARSDSSPQVITTFNTHPAQSLVQSPVQSSVQSPDQQLRFIDFFQTLPKYVFDRLKRPPQTELVSFNSLESRPVNQFDSYHSYETVSSNDQPMISQLKPANKPPVPLKSNELDDIYSTNESYEDDDVIVVPFTKHRGAAFKDGKPYVGKNVQGVPKPPTPMGYDASNEFVASNNLKIEKKFASKMITDSEDDLETGDELPSSLSDDSRLESPDFKVQFSDLHPVYVKPPKEFQPIFYPNREIDGSKFINRNDEATVQPLVTDKNQELPNKYPNGLSSWLLGGYRFGNRGAWWESLLKDESLYGYNTPITGKKVAESIDNSLDKLDFSDNKPSTVPVVAIKSSGDLNNAASSLSEDDKFEFISLNEPKSSSTDDLVELKKEKNVKKAFLIGSKLKSSSPVLSAKHSLLKRNLRPKKVKILTTSDKLFDKNVKKSN